MTGSRSVDATTDGDPPRGGATVPRRSTGLRRPGGPLRWGPRKRLLVDWQRLALLLKIMRQDVPHDLSEGSVRSRSTRTLSADIRRNDPLTSGAHDTMRGRDGGSP
jgi:hypothetical protein